MTIWVAHLLQNAWDTTYYGDTRAVDSAIKRLRAKLRRVDPDATFIATVRGVGYRLDAARTAPP